MENLRALARRKFALLAVGVFVLMAAAFGVGFFQGGSGAVKSAGTFALAYYNCL